MLTLSDRNSVVLKVEKAADTLREVAAAIYNIENKRGRAMGKIDQRLHDRLRRAAAQLDEHVGGYLLGCPKIEISGGSRIARSMAKLRAISSAGISSRVKKRQLSSSILGSLTRRWGKLCARAAWLRILAASGKTWIRVTCR